MPNPIDNPELFDAIVLGGQTSPGVVTLSGHDRKVNWDVKSGSGQKGATTTLKDIPPKKFSASFYLADIEEIDAWQPFQDLIESTVAGATPKALDVYHPDLARNGFSAVVMERIAGVVHDKKGGQTVTVEFLEYLPPKPKGGTPSGARTTRPTTPDPNQAALDELARLTTQYQNTPWG